MSYSVFISYRREGGEGFAQMFNERLSKKRYRVFYDIESIGVGIFDKKILDEIKKSDVFVLMLSKDALNRCVNDDDWVRQEISYALKLGKPIIPLFFRGFRFPDNLPKDIEMVKLYNGIDIRDMNFLDSKFKQLCKMINDAAKAPRVRADEPETPAPMPLPQKEVKKTKVVKYAKNVKLSSINKRNALANKYFKKALNAGEARFRLIPHKFFYLKKYHYYVKAAELGHYKALNFLFTNNIYADYSVNHLHDTKAIVVKRYNLNKASERHEPFALFLEGLILHKEFCNNWSKWTDLINVLTESAECGYTLSQIMLGSLYSVSNDINLSPDASNYIYQYAKDYQRALYWYNKAGEQGSAYAYCQIGILYEYGKAAISDMEKATFYYRRGAEMGDPDAQYRLGKCYMDGDGVDKDRNQAIILLKLAAEQGHAGAQGALVTALSD